MNFSLSIAIITLLATLTLSVSPALADRSSIPLKELEALTSGTCYLIWNNFHQIPDNISVGDRRYEIRALQKLLKSAGNYSGPIDGVYGAASLEAVRTFQKENSIPADDSVGAQTVAYLYGFDKSASSPDLKKN